MRSEQRVCFVLGSTRLPCGRRAKSSFPEKRPEYQEEKTNVKCNSKGENAITGWAQR